MFFPIMPSFSGALPAFDTTLTYSSDTADVNIFTAAGSPGGAVNVRVNVEATADIYASTTGNYAMDCNGFAAGSLIYIFCDGRICGKGGAAASGGSGTSNGSAGNAGGPALRLGAETVISGSGSINGGGGGGGGAGGTRNSGIADPEVGCEVQNLTGGNGGAGCHQYHYRSEECANGRVTTGPDWRVFARHAQRPRCAAGY